MNVTNNNDVEYVDFTDVNESYFKLWTFNESEEINHWGFMIESGDYKGLVVEILNFTSKSHEDGSLLGDLIDDGPVDVQIEYGVLKKPDNVNEDIFQTKLFEDFVQRTISLIFKQTAKKFNEQNRDNNFKQSDTQ